VSRARFGLTRVSLRPGRCVRTAKSTRVTALCEKVDHAALGQMFDRPTIARGVSYVRDGHVLHSKTSSDGHAIDAQVTGSDIAPYSVHIKIEHRTSGHVEVFGNCSCPMEYMCKHVVATLVAAIEARTGEANVPHRRNRTDGLDPRIELWIAEIDEATAAPQSSPDALLYLLSADTTRRLRFELVTARRKKDGSWGAPRRFSADSSFYYPAAALTAEDAHAVRILYGVERQGSRFREESLEAALRIALRSNRVYWHTAQTPLRLADPRRAELVWLPRTDGTQRLEGIVEGTAVEVLSTTRLWGIDPQRGDIFELECELDQRLSATLFTGPPVRDTDAPSVTARLSRLNVPVPRSSLSVTVVAEPPVPHLWLERAPPPRYHWGAESPPTASARITFAYGDAMVAPEAAEREWRSATDAGVCVRRRDADAERAALSELERRGLRYVTLQYTSNAVLEAVRPSARFWTSFVVDDVFALQQLGWVVHVADDFPHRVVASDAPWEIEASGIGDLTVEVALVLEGKRIPLVPLLTRAIAAGGIQKSGDRAIVGPLDDGSMVSLPAERLQRLVDVLLEVFDRPNVAEKTVTLPLARALALDGLGDGTQLGGAAAMRVRDAVRALSINGARRVALPRTLRATLRPYQHDGYAWLQRLRGVGFGGILADSMGLGKTVQTLAHLLAERKAGRLQHPALVIAPTSTLPNWEAEVRRFAPSLRTLVLHGPNRGDRYDDIDDAHLVVTSYALLVRDAEILIPRQWSVAVLDEAQNIKNANAKTAKIARLLRAEQRLCLTGTPLENHLGELWSLFAFVEPAVLGERERFGRIFRTPIEKRDDAQRRAALASRIAPFVLRRTKERVASDLPPKSEIVTRVELDEQQRDLYETIRAAMHARVQEAIARRGLARSTIVILDALLKLRQVCCHPRLLPVLTARGVTESAKLDALREMVEEMVDDGRRILLFSQFTSMLRLIEQELVALSIPYVQLTGSTVDRATPVRQFQSGEVPVFLISLKAGGTGLNLTAADTVIHYDPWWNPAVERQATDRAHRIGQTKPIFVYKLVCEDTIEEKILELQARKGAIADALLDETATALPLDADEVARLFA